MQQHSRWLNALCLLTWNTSAVATYTQHFHLEATEMIEAFAMQFTIVPAKRMHKWTSKKDGKICLRCTLWLRTFLAAASVPCWVKQRQAIGVRERCAWISINGNQFSRWIKDDIPLLWATFHVIRHSNLSSFPSFSLSTDKEKNQNKKKLVTFCICLVFPLSLI